jgi:hypothetical protein
MALTLDNSGTVTPTVGDAVNLATVTGPKVVVVALDLSFHNSSQIALQWRIDIGVGYTTVWADTFTVDDSVMAGYLSPPIPAYTQAVCNLTVVSGSDATDITFAVYAL